TGLHAVLTVNAKADQRTDLATKLDRLVLRKVAQMSNLDAAIRVLVHGQRIDHTHRIARPQPLQLGDDLTVEVRLAKTQDEQLYRANSHHSIPSLVDSLNHSRRRAGTGTRSRSPLARYTQVTPGAAADELSHRIGHRSDLDEQRTAGGTDDH